MLIYVFAAPCFLVALVALRFLFYRKPSTHRIPLSVNYHFTRKCNYSCGFCFHTAKTSTTLDIEEAKRGLTLLAQAGMKKLNLAGGEPLLKTYQSFVGELIRFAKEELHLESVSIVSNGSQLCEKWFAEYGRYIDILAISCDSFKEETNVLIGRGKGSHIIGLKRAKDICNQHNIKFKINSVINSYNFEEDMNSGIKELEPFRWKCFQVLKLKGENSGAEGEKRDVTKFLISKEQFQAFLERHKHQKSLVPEGNEAMRNSYLILDEEMRFLNCTEEGKVAGKSLLEVGVAEALKESGWDDKMFQDRGGYYEWTRENASSGGCDMKAMRPEYDW